MQDKLHIYPYQRISEGPINGKNTFRRRVFNLNNKINLDLQSILAGSAIYLNSLLTLDRLLPAVLIVFMSRAFILGELLPFVYACLAAFGHRDRTRSAL
ncbi:MAG: hypothetical protein M0P20_10425, partial [Methanocorpusculum sp.]|nr:hypothetical protein [Methanocorpusculum sp.]